MKKWIPYICTAAAVVIAVLGWIFLADPITIQVSRDGLSATTVPKIVAIPVPLLVSIVGSILNYRGLKARAEEAEESKSTEGSKGDGDGKKDEGNGQAMLISALGLVILVVMLWANLG